MPRGVMFYDTVDHEIFTQSVVLQTWQLQSQLSRASCITTSRNFVSILVLVSMMANGKR